ncbi:MAG: DUF5749 family beta-barrel protein [Archaeoglobaceae archaeon]|nr:hypothetical protein [Archaeoglobaceae archaeon]MDW7989746.1 DUF5749 family beta-barrel protein [Archaeoglobaceae archaeon]
MICRFVYKDGKEYGESIDVYEDYLIVKVREKFIAVPMGIVKFDGEKIIVKDFDEEKGIEIGIKWMSKFRAFDEKELKFFGFCEEDGV